MHGQRHGRTGSLVIGFIAAASLAIGSVAPVSAGPIAAPRTDAAALFAATSWRPVARSISSADDVRLAPGTNGRLFVAIRRTSSTVVAGFDSSGRLLAGWPRTLTAWTDCWIGTVAIDGSVRLVCRTPDPGDASESVIRAVAFSATGRRLAGWPVDLTKAAGAGYRDFAEPRVVGNRLFVLMGWGQLRLVRIAADGATTAGKVVDLPLPDQTSEEVPFVHWVRSLGSDGTAFAVRKEFKGSVVRSSILAFGLNGPRAGWPVAITGNASVPTVGPNGRAYVVVAAADGRSAWIRVFERDGTRVAGWSRRLAVEPESAWRGAGAPVEGPASPVVARDGSAWLVGERVGVPGMKAWALTPTGAVRSGWPVRSDSTVPDCGRCDGCVTGCGNYRVGPVAGPGGVLYLALDARTATVGGRIAALDLRGRNRPGWPVTLTRRGAEFWSVAVASNGTVYALAVEPESRSVRDGCTFVKSSATILAIAPGGAVRYRLTVMDP
jgi:hypothetical protein